jgi:hypothetical protein
MQITEMNSDERYLIVRGSGKFDPALALALFKQVVEASIRLQRPRVMIDFVNVEGEISVLTLYEMGVKVSQLGAALTHLALVERPERILPDRFWQNVARNRGLNVMVCASEAEAASFLMNTPEFVPIESAG